MSILDTDAQVRAQIRTKVYIAKIKNIEAMNDFQSFSTNHAEALVRLHGELFQTEYYNSYSYTGIARYFQIEFPETKDYTKAAFLLREFLLREGIVNRNSVIANMLPENLVEMVKYVDSKVGTNKTQDIFELLLKDKHDYANKIKELCEDIVSHFSYLKSAAAVMAILSLMTGWCPILHKNFVQTCHDVNIKQIAKDLFVVIDTFEPLIKAGCALGVIQANVPMTIIWSLLLFAQKCYNNYSNL